MPVHYTKRALTKLKAIRAYSNENFGELVSDDYMVDLNHKAIYLEKRKHPEPERAKPFLLERAREHFLIYDVYDDNIYVVEIFGQRQDIEARIADAAKDICDELMALRAEIEERL